MRKPISASTRRSGNRVASKRWGEAWIPEAGSGAHVGSASGDFAPTLEVLGWIPGLAVTAVESSCCGMAGPFGFDASHYEVSMRMAELSLLPAVRAADQDTLIVAGGTSCRHQIADAMRGSAPRTPLHVARVLERASRSPTPSS